MSRIETPKGSSGSASEVTHSDSDPRSIGALLKEFRDEVTALFHQEVELARTEVSEKVSRVMRNSALVGAGALIAFAGLIVLLQAAGAGLVLGLEAMGLEENALWLGPLIVGAIVVVVGAGILLKGKSTLKHESVVPERTKESLKENKQWVKSKVT